MKNLSGFLKFLKKHHLSSLAKEYSRQLQETNIPVERVIPESISETVLAAIEAKLSAFLSITIEKGSEDSLVHWQQAIKQGLEMHTLLITDLVPLINLYKKTLISYLHFYTDKVNEAACITNELLTYCEGAEVLVMNSLLKTQQNYQYTLGEWKRAEHKVIQLNRQLENSREEFEKFTYIASHDLQEPLRIISNYLGLLESRYKDKLDKDAGEFIEYAINGSTRMRELIISLLNYSRVNRFKPFSRIDCNAMLDETLENMDDFISKNKATIISDELPRIQGDKILLSELFQNLIGNAIKFRNDEKDPVVEISVERKESRFLFAVKDNGIGFEQKYAPKVFEAFQRLHSREKYEGSGIGLTICKKIVERHGGNIWVESTNGEGSVFYFTLDESIKN